MGQNYLHDCLNQFSDISEQRFHRPSDLQAAENGAKHLQTGTVSVQAIHQHFHSSFKEKPEYGWFNDYWLFPSFDDLRKEDQQKTFTFHQLSKGNEGNTKEQDVIQDLLGIFRHIELVSNILRFICPKSFGILSPPVEYVLALRRGKNAVEVYMNYLRNLREIRSKYGFSRVADVDMALWVLKHKCYDNNMVDAGIKQAFEKDEFMLQLRASNLVEPLNELSPVQLATALCGANNHLAALVGCYALEANVKKLAEIEKVTEEAARIAAKDGSKPQKPSLPHYLEALKSKGKITNIERGELSRLQKSMRNKMFHGEISDPDPQEVIRLVKAVSDIAQRLSEHSDR